MAAPPATRGRNARSRPARAPRAGYLPRRSTANRRSRPAGRRAADPPPWPHRRQLPKSRPLGRAPRIEERVDDDRHRHGLSIAPPSACSTRGRHEYSRVWRDATQQRAETEDQEPPPGTSCADRSDPRSTRRGAGNSPRQWCKRRSTTATLRRSRADRCGSRAGRC